MKTKLLLIYKIDVISVPLWFQVTAEPEESQSYRMLAKLAPNCKEPEDCDRTSASPRSQDTVPELNRNKHWTLQWSEHKALKKRLN